METKLCPKCGAKWLEDQHYWSTGARGNEADLAGLVCDNLPPESVGECINAARGTDHGGDTWDKRALKIQELFEEIQDK